MLPGATLFTRIPNSDHSNAMVRPKAFNPAFAAPYMPWVGAVVMPLIDETFTMEPRIPCAIIDRAAA